MILHFEMPQLDIPDVDRNHILEFFLVQVRKIISVQEIYSDSLFHKASNHEGIRYSCEETI